MQVLFIYIMRYDKNNDAGEEMLSIDRYIGRKMEIKGNEYF